MSGFAFVGMYCLPVVETLHQDHQGLGRRIVSHVQDTLSAADFERVNQQLLQTPPFPGQPLHSKGFLGNGITVHVAYCMLQRLSAPILTLAERGSPTEPLKHWLEWRR